MITVGLGFKHRVMVGVRVGARVGVMIIKDDLHIVGKNENPCMAIKCTY